MLATTLAPSLPMGRAAAARAQARMTKANNCMVIYGFKTKVRVWKECVLDAIEWDEEAEERRTEFD